MKTKNTLLFIICMSLFEYSFSQITFLREYLNGNYSRDSKTRFGVEQTSDGGYILAGITKDDGSGHTDMCLIKTTSNGTVLWSKTYGDTTQLDEAFTVHQTLDGGYILAGCANRSSGAYRHYIIKTNSSGDTLWTKTISNGNSDMPGSDINTTNDSGFIVCGYSYASGTKVILTKLNSAGIVQWYKRLDNSYGARCYSAIQTNDGGFIVAGETHSGNDYALLIKTDSLGNTLWAKYYEGVGGNSGFFKVNPTTDGGYIAAGWTQGSNSVIIKINSVGDTLWTRVFNSSIFISAIETPDGGYFLTGAGFIAKTNSIGDTLWTRFFDPYYRMAHAGNLTSDGGYIIAGLDYDNAHHPLKLFLMKTDSQGLSGCNQYQYPFMALSYFNGTVTPFTCTVSTGIDTLSAKISIRNVVSDSVLCLTTGLNELDNVDQFAVYPNPAHNKIHLSFGEKNKSFKVELTNNIGELLFYETYQNVENIELDVSQLPSGIYFVKFSSDQFNACKKVIIN